MPQKQSSAKPNGSVFDAAVRAIVSHGIAEVQLRDIAAEAGLTLLGLYDRIPTRRDLPRFLAEEIDRSMVAGAEETDPVASVRDRLFELLMSRFDRMMPLRDAMRQFGHGSGAKHAGVMLIDLPGALISLKRSMALALELAGVPVSGIAGEVRIRGLMLVYLATMRSWLNDDSPDLGATMKTLDQQLARAERWASRIP